MFAHDAASLQLPLDSVRQKVLAVVGSTSSGTQLSAAALEGAGTDSGSGGAASQAAAAEGVAPAAAAGSSSRREQDWGFAGTDGADASAAGSGAAPSDSSSMGHSLGGGGGGGSSSGPAQQPKPQQGWRQRRGPLPHEEQLQRLLANRSRPAELKPCLSHEECGKCYVLGCPYAHGVKERRARERRCVLRFVPDRQAALCQGAAACACSAGAATVRATYQSPTIRNA